MSDVTIRISAPLPLNLSGRIDAFVDSLLLIGIHCDVIVEEEPKAELFEFADQYEGANMLIWLFEHEASLDRTEDYLYSLEYTLDAGAHWLNSSEHPDAMVAIRQAMANRITNVNAYRDRRCVSGSHYVRDLEIRYEKLANEKRIISRKYDTLKNTISQKLDELQRTLRETVR